MTGESLLAFDVQQNVLNPVVLGVIQGSVYGLVGLGLVLLYKSNRIFNFAQGEFGTVAALIGFACLSGQGRFPKLPYALAIVVGLLAGALTGLLTERLVIRPLFHRPRVTMLVATAGVALTLIATELLVLGPNANNFPPVKPAVPPARTIFGGLSDSGSLKIQWQQVAMLLVFLALGVGAALFFRYSAYGTAILAVSQEPTAAAVVGVEVSRVSALTWTIAGFLGAAAGLLLAPLSQLSPGFMTLRALIPAFTAAVVGGITSLPGAFAGGLLIGIVEQLGLVNLRDLPGSGTTAIAVTLLVILLVRPTGLLGKET